MTLTRQLLTVVCGVLSLAFFLRGSFLLAQRFFITPSDHPLVVAAQADTPAVPQTLLLPGDSNPLPVIPTTVVNNDWQVSSQGVSLLQSTHRDSGKILYGHNWPTLLGGLKHTEIGDVIQLRYSDYSQEAYMVQSTFTVTPSRLDVLNLARDPDILLIYTCSGWLDQDRFVVLARRTPVEPNEQASL